MPVESMHPIVVAIQTPQKEKTKSLSFTELIAPQGSA